MSKLDDLIVPASDRRRWLGECLLRALDHGMFPFDLDVQARQVVRLRFGLDGDSKSIDETATIVGLPAQEVEELEKELAKLAEQAADMIAS